MVPFGTTEKIVRPSLEDEPNTRGLSAPLLLAHAYERIMLASHYVSLIYDQLYNQKGDTFILNHYCNFYDVFFYY